ncbi:hypothetical protein GQ600_16273 [Phytophthora cactorum]|nr:hypothetical protein GQ600_16273 [Phytophthora cactorum]
MQPLQRSPRRSLRWSNKRSRNARPRSAHCMGM